MQKCTEKRTKCYTKVGGILLLIGMMVVFIVGFGLFGVLGGGCLVCSLTGKQTRASVLG